MIADIKFNKKIIIKRRLIRSFPLKKNYLWFKWSNEAFHVGLLFYFQNKISCFSGFKPKFVILYFYFRKTISVFHYAFSLKKSTNKREQKHLSFKRLFHQPFVMVLLLCGFFPRFFLSNRKKPKIKYLCNKQKLDKLS